MPKKETTAGSHPENAAPWVLPVPEQPVLLAEKMPAAAGSACCGT